jgi:6-phosphofructokinase 1
MQIGNRYGNRCQMGSAQSGVAVVAHGGGPTPVLNSSLAGVIAECRKHPEITALHGASSGLPGILAERFLDLGKQDPALVARIADAPSSALGTSRRPLKDEDFERIETIFRARNVRYLFYNGGNGSMDTAHRLACWFEHKGADVRVIGIPKTIDNDLMGTDHSPGYATTARFFACAVRDIGVDNRALPSITAVEILGRNAGWLAAATAFARHEPDDAPHLIYLPERRLPVEQLLEDVDRVYRRLGRVVVAVCEGQLDEAGEPFGADVRTSSRQPLALNLAHTLAQIISARLGISARSEKPGLLGRSSVAHIGPYDRAEARMCGEAAVQAAVKGATDQMVTLVRQPGSVYRVTTSLTPLEAVANVERPFPAEWMRPAADSAMAPEFRVYAAPLIGEIEAHARLAPLFV